MNSRRAPRSFRLFEYCLIIGLLCYVISFELTGCEALLAKKGKQKPKQTQKEKQTQRTTTNDDSYNKGAENTWPFADEKPDPPEIAEVRQIVDGTYPCGKFKGLNRRGGEKNVSPKSKKHPKINKSEDGETDTIKNGTRKGKASKKITKGLDAQPGQFPSFVEVWNYDWNDPNKPVFAREKCAGTLITSLVNYKKQFLALKPGYEMTPNYTFSNDVQWTFARRYCGNHRWERTDRRHPEFLLLDDNYALIMLDKPFKFTDTVQPACVHTRQQPVKFDRNYLAGAGPIDRDPEHGWKETQLKYLEMVQLDRQQCRRRENLCFKSAQGQGMGCRADSGAGLIGIADGKQYLRGPVVSVDRVPEHEAWYDCDPDKKFSIYATNYLGILTEEFFWMMENCVLDRKNVQDDRWRIIKKP